MKVIARTLEEAMRLFSLVRGAGQGESNREGGTGSACVMSAARWLEGRNNSEWNDQPETVCKAMTHYYINLNDCLSNEERKLLWPHALKALHSELPPGSAAWKERIRVLSEAQRVFHQAYAEAMDPATRHEAVVEYLKAFDAALDFGRNEAIAYRRKKETQG